MTIEKLKPCPFCGGVADVYSLEETITHDKYQLHSVNWTAECSECGCVIGGKYHTRKEAIKAWNWRDNHDD